MYSQCTCCTMKCTSLLWQQHPSGSWTRSMHLKAVRFKLKHCTRAASHTGKHITSTTMLLNGPEDTGLLRARGRQLREEDVPSSAPPSPASQGTWSWQLLRPHGNPGLDLGTWTTSSKEGCVREWLLSAASYLEGTWAEQSQSKPLLPVVFSSENVMLGDIKDIFMAENKHSLFQSCISQFETYWNKVFEVSKDTFQNKTLE